MQGRTWYFRSFSTGIQPVSEAMPARLAIHGTLWAAEAAPIPCPACL
ncbi:MAG: hypothetical protein QMD44_10150 [Thermodesulfovibrionales bacterium]|nr:hypothetical protein [Thermodesulfovibrionales bacterium]